jgi:hypothetical protein
MLNEIGRILAVVVLLVARLVGRAWRGLTLLVRAAARTRSATASSVPSGGRMLDVAALSVAADLLVVAEWWRRSTPPEGLAAVLGLGGGVVASTAAAVFLRRTGAPRLLLAGAEILRLGCVLAFAFVPTIVVAGGTADTALGSAAIGGLVGLALVERTLWTLCVRGLAPRPGPAIGAAARYAGLLFVPMVLMAVVGLIVGGPAALLMAQVALLAAVVQALLLAPAAKPKPVAAKAEPPPPTQTVDLQGDAPATGEVPYHLYRPSSLDPPDGTP